MSLSTDLLMQFAKSTNGNAEQHSGKERYAYGKVVIENNQVYVIFDGSTIKTSVSTTVDVNPNDRVMVLLKNHTAVITGNLTANVSSDISPEAFHSFPEKAPELTDELFGIGTGKFRFNVEDLVELVETAVEYVTDVTVDGSSVVENKVAAIDITGKVDKVDGKDLSSNDYTTEDKTKVGKLLFDSSDKIDPSILPTSGGVVTIDQVYPIGSIYMSTANVDPAVLFGGIWARLENRFLLAAGSSYNLGDTGGEASHTLSVDELPTHAHGLASHTHTITHGHGFTQPSVTGGAHTHQYGYMVANRGTGTGSTRMGPYGHSSSGVTKIGSSSESHTHTVSGGAVTQHTGSSGGATGNTANAGSGHAHNNMPPYLVVNMWQRTG